MTRRRFHLALAVRDLEASILDYSKRLGTAPCCVVDGTYALFRTDEVNLSISVQPDGADTLRHLGFEDQAASGFAVEVDVNGIEWERFSEQQQLAEILERWPLARILSVAKP
jgi:extradiol dioxygenase family protein